MRGNDEAHQTRFYACFALALAATIAVAFAANLLTLFLAYELLTLVTYPLVTHHGTPEAMRAGRVYLGVLLGTSIPLLFVAMVAYLAHRGHAGLPRRRHSRWRESATRRSAGCSPPTCSASARPR